MINFLKMFSENGVSHYNFLHNNEMTGKKIRFYCESVQASFITIDSNLVNELFTL